MTCAETERTFGANLMPDRDVTEDRLYSDSELVQFYDLENGWAPDQQTCARMAREAASVLDLGCGTGQFAARISGEREVFGVDPAGAMLEVARARPGGENVNWFQGTAQAVRLGRSFDLIVLTGHAFQVFLTEADQRAVLETIATHLSPEGRFIFDTRNPAVEEWREWTPQESLRFVTHPELGKVKAWNDAARDPATGVVTYETHYQAVESGRHFSASSQIQFPSWEKLATLIEEAGLKTTEWLGDWHGSPWTPKSPEIIPIGRLAQD